MLCLYLCLVIITYIHYACTNVCVCYRLKCHLKPNGKLYFVGMNPIPDHPHYPGNIVSEVYLHTIS